VGSWPVVVGGSLLGVQVAFLRPVWVVGVAQGWNID